MNVTAAVIRKNGKILICRRAKDDECGLMWEFPGGKQEGDESLKQCITREIREELELDIALKGIFTTSEYHYAAKRIFFTVFNAGIKGGQLRLNVHDEARWVFVKDLVNYQFMPADRVFVEKLLKETD